MKNGKPIYKEYVENILRFLIYFIRKSMTRTISRTALPRWCSDTIQQITYVALGSFDGAVANTYNPSQVNMKT